MDTFQRRTLGRFRLLLMVALVTSVASAPVAKVPMQTAGTTFVVPHQSVVTPSAICTNCVPIPMAVVHQSVVVPRAICPTCAPITRAVVPSASVFPGETLHTSDSKVNSTGGTFGIQQSSTVCVAPYAILPVLVPVVLLPRPALPRVTSTPTQVLIPQLDNSTTVQPSATTSPAPDYILFMDAGGTLSPRVVMGIIVAFAIFVACYVSFCCLCCGCCGRPQQRPESRPPQRAGPRPLQVPRPRQVPSRRRSLSLIVAGVNILTRTPTRASSGSGRRSVQSDITLTSRSGVPPAIEAGKDSAAEEQPTSPRLADGGARMDPAGDGGDPRPSFSNTVSTVAANEDRPDDQDTWADGRSSNPRPSSSIVITIGAGLGGPSGRDSVIEEVEMVAPTVARPPPARRKPGRPRAPLLEGASPP